MQRISIILISLFSLFLCQPIIAADHHFFDISATGQPAKVSLILCLHAQEPISCQIYQVSALNLTIRSRIPQHTYPSAGIKITTPGYTIANPEKVCRPLSNGFCSFSISESSPVTVTLNGPDHVDYVIVGAGTAGAVMAKKLSDDKQTSVIALQNGPNLDQNPLITLSKNAIYTVLAGLIGPPLYADGETIKQPFADFRNLRWVYALPLGGASSVNAGAWCRGTNQVYSQWEAINGPNWSVDRILKTYKELENYHGFTTDPKARGYHGPLPIRQEKIPSMVSETFTKAVMRATGVPFVLDYNDPNTPIGASSQLQYTQMGVAGTFRSSSAITFLNNKVMTPDGRGVDGRKLQVLFEATAQDIIWNGNQAVGVRYVRHGDIHNLYAKKGVIVSAGIKSSAFLMRSGVGPKELLQSLNIPVVYDNPNVGQALADQPHVVLVYSSNPWDSTAATEMLDLGNIITALAKTDLGRAIIERIGSEVALRNGVFAQIAWLPAPGGNPEVRALRFATVNLIPGITLALFDLVQPASRGSIEITSSDPFHEPAMNLGVFSNSADLDLYVSGFQNYIKGINEQLHLIDPEYEMLYPDPTILNDTPKLIDFIKKEVGSNMHFQSHCRMAPLDQGGVVDNTGHVYGVQNLIVADDSIVPVNMDGSPMATAYLISANIANLLLGR
jgi:choline dehydrogenase-like flavoprotein